MSICITTTAPSDPKVLSVRDLTLPSTRWKLVDMVTNFTNCNLGNMDLDVEMTTRNENSSSNGGQFTNCSIGHLTFINVTGIQFDNCSKIPHNEIHDNRTVVNILASTAVMKGLNVKNALGKTFMLLQGGSQLDIMSSSFSYNQYIEGLIKVDDNMISMEPGQEEQIQTHSKEKETTKLSIFSSVFEYNSANIGSVINAANPSQIYIEGSSFFRNSAEEMGGAICVQNSSLIINMSTFDSCESPLGAAMYAKSCSIVSVQSSMFQNNCNQITNGTIFMDGFDELEIVNTTMERNKAVGVGSCVYATTDVHATNANQTYLYNQTNMQLIQKFRHTATDEGVGNKSNGTLEIQHILVNDSPPTISIVDSLFKRNEAWNGTIYTGKSMNIILHNVTLERNRAKFPGGKGGLLVDSFSMVNITDSHFIKNDAGQGAGVFAEEKVRMVVTGSAFIDNSAEIGAGICIEGNSSLVVTHSVFEENQAVDPGRGAGISARTNCIVDIRASNFTKNIADHGAGVTIENTSRLLISNSIFKGNIVHTGGGINVDLKSEAIIKDCYFTKNRASIGPAVAVHKNSKADISRSTFYKNGDGFTGGVVSVRIDSHADFKCVNFTDNEAHTGSIACFEHAHIDIWNSYFARNRAGQGGCISCNLNSSADISHSHFTENKALSYGSVALVDFQSELSLKHSILTQNIAPKGTIYTGTADLTMENITMTRNKATIDGAALYATDASTIVIQNSNFKGNRANKYGSILTAQKNVQIHVKSSTIRSNKASVAAFSLSDSSNLTVADILFQDNKAKGPFPGFYIAQGSRLFIYNSNFTDNLAYHNYNRITEYFVPETFRDSSFINVLNSLVYIEHSNFTGNIDASRSIGNSMLFVSNGEAVLQSSNITNSQAGMCIILEKSTFRLSQTNVINGRNGREPLLSAFHKCGVLTYETVFLDKFYSDAPDFAQALLKEKEFREATLEDKKVATTFKETPYASGRMENSK